MRIIVFMCLLLVVAGLAPAQQMAAVQPTVSSVVDRMNSPRWREREKAFEEATNLVASGKRTPADLDRVRLGVIQLLATENNDKVPAADEREGEENSEYYASLIGFVANLGDERAIPSLLGASSTGGIAIRGVAQFGKKALDPTLEQVKSLDSKLASGAVFVIREMLLMGTVSDPESHLRVKNALRSALASPEFLVRISAIGAIECLDDREEFVPILKEVAEHDPVKLAGQQPDDGGDKGEFYPARRDARRLLRKIANHQSPVIDKGVSR
jgi:hypothetical protein